MSLGNAAPITALPSRHAIKRCLLLAIVAYCLL